MTTERRFWTPAMIAAVGGSVASLILAFATLYVALDVKEDTQHIVISTNNTLSVLQQKLEVALARIEGLEKTVALNAANKKIADELAIKEAVKSP